MKRTFLVSYAGLLIGILPLIFYRFYENLGINGGLNEILEGLLLHLILFVPIAIVLVFVVKALEKLDINLSNKILFLVALVVSVALFYLT